jgi:hypothetical protein
MNQEIRSERVVTWYAAAMEVFGGLAYPIRELGRTEIQPGETQVHIGYLDTGIISTVVILRDDDIVGEVEVHRVAFKGEDLTVELEEGFWEGIS